MEEYCIFANPPKSIFPCGICFDEINTELTIDPGHSPVVCNDCSTIFHSRCLGSSTATSFTCDECLTITRSCILCRNIEGYLKSLENDKWVHPICALLSDDIEIDYLTMGAKILQETETKVSLCDYCQKQKGQVLECNHYECSKAVHAFCAFNHKYQDIHWQIRLELGVENKKMEYPEFREYINKEENKIIKEEMKMKDIEVVEHDHKNAIIARRGGQIKVYCQEHSIEALNCSCGKYNRIETNEAIFRCSYCGKLSHYECMGSGLEEGDTKCSICIEWEDAKKSYLLNGQHANSDILLFPAKTDKLVDILLIAQIYLIRGQTLLKSQSDIKILYKHLVQANLIPVQLFTIIEELKKKIKLSMELDKQVEDFLKEINVLNIINENYMPIEENSRRNIEIKHVVDSFIQKYDFEIKTQTSTFHKVKHIQQMLETLKELSEKFLSYIEIDEAVLHLKRLEECGLHFSNEIQFLKDTINQFNVVVERLIHLVNIHVDDNMIYPKRVEEVGDVVERIEKMIKDKLPLDKIDHLYHELTLGFIRKEEITDRLINEKMAFEERQKTYKQFIEIGCTIDQFKSLIKEICQSFILTEDNIIKDYQTYLKLYLTSIELLNEVTTIQDLNAALKKCKESKIKPLDVIENLSNRLEDINKWKETYKQLIENETSIEPLNDHIAKGKELKVTFPEFNSLESKIEIANEVKSLIDSKKAIEYDRLYHLVDEAENNKILNESVEYLKSLLVSAKTLHSEAERLISACTESYNEIDNVHKCIENIKSLYIKIPALEELEKIGEEYKYQTEIAVMTNTPHEETLDYPALDNLSQEILEELYSKLKTTSQVRPIFKLKKMIVEVLWLKRAKAILDPINKITEKQLNELIKEIKSNELDASHFYCGRYVKLALNLNEKYKKILADYEVLKRLNVDDVEENEVNKLLQRVYNLKQDAFICQVNLSDLIAKIHKVKQYIDAYQTLFNLMKAKESFDFSAYVKAFDNLAIFQEAHGSSKLLEKARQQIEKYKEWMDKVNTYKTNKGHSLHSNFNLQSIKTLIQDAKDIELPLGNNLELLINDIKHNEENEVLAKEYLIRLRNKDPSIKTEEIENLISKMQELPLYSQEIFISLRIYLLLYQLKDLLNPTADTTKKKLNYWSKLLEEREQLSTQRVNKEDLDELAKGDLAELLTTKYREGVMLMKQVKDLKEQKSRAKFSVIDLELLLDFLKNSYIDFNEEIEYAQSLMDTSKSLEDSFKELLSKKGHIADFKTLNNQIQKLPLNLNETEESLNKVIASGAELTQKVKTLLAESRRIREKPKESEVAALLNEYSKLECKVNEAEHLKTQYEEAKTFISKSKETLEKNPSIEEITCIENRVAGLPIDINVLIKPLRLDLCRKKYVFIVGSKDRGKLAFASLTALLEEFNKLKSLLTPLDLEKVKHLQQLISEARNSARVAKESIEQGRHEMEVLKRFSGYNEPRVSSNPMTLAGKRPKPSITQDDVILPKPEVKKTETKKLQDEEIRARTRKSFEIVISNNLKLRNGQKKAEVLAREVEEGLFNQSGDIKTVYREKSEQIKKNLAKFAEYPLSSEYIANGKLELWKLLKIRNDTSFSKKLNSIENILVKEVRKIKKLEEIPPKQDAYVRYGSNSDLQAALYQDDRRQLMSEGYDPLNPFSITSMLPEIATISLPNLTPQENYKKDDGSPEDAEIIGKDQFTLDYKKPSLLSDDNKPYDPLDTVINQPIPTSFKPNILIPFSYQDNEQPIEVVPTGSLLKVWEGRISTGKFFFEASMFTNDDIRNYMQAPALNSTIGIDGRAKLSLVFDYINNNASRLLLLKGWMVVSENSALNKYLLELETTEKCGVIDVKEIASHLYLIPWNAKTLNFFQKWGVSPIYDDIKEKAMIKFAYFFAFKNRKVHGVYKLMRPIVIKSDMVGEVSFPGISQADPISDDEESQNNPKAGNYKVREDLKHTLNALCKEDIEKLKSQFSGENRIKFEKFLEEISSGRRVGEVPLHNIDKTSFDYPTEIRPIEVSHQIESCSEESPARKVYLSKLLKVQNFIDKNKEFFRQYALDLPMQQSNQMKYIPNEF